MSKSTEAADAEVASSSCKDEIIKGLNEDGSLKEPTLGTTGSENFWSDMKRS
jgi:hypothetical protein